jgi:hypothetical protein
MFATSEKAKLNTENIVKRLELDGGQAYNCWNDQSWTERCLVRIVNTHLEYIMCYKHVKMYYVYLYLTTDLTRNEVCMKRKCKYCEQYSWHRHWL